MVWHFVRQVKQSKHAVRNCVATHSVEVLEYMTLYLVMLHTRDWLQVQLARMKHFILFVLATFSPVHSWSLMCLSWYIWRNCLFFFFYPGLSLFCLVFWLFFVVVLSLFSWALMAVKPSSRLHSLWLMGFSPRYSSFPIHPLGLGCLELEDFFLFQGQIQTIFFFLLMNPYSKAQHSPPPPPPPPRPSSLRLSLSLFCSISVLGHIIFITSHLLHIIVMPTIFQSLNNKNLTKTI